MVGTLSLQPKCHSAASKSTHCFVASSSPTSSYAQFRKQYLQVWGCVFGSGCISPRFDAQHHQAVLRVQDQSSTAAVVSAIASREQENMVGKPYAQSLSRTQNMSPQRVPTERFQVPAQHYQALVTVNTACFPVLLHIFITAVSSSPAVTTKHRPCCCIIL